MVNALFWARWNPVFHIQFYILIAFSANEWSNNIEKRKPSYGISTFIFLRMIYYMFYGRRIVQLLDDQCFATPYRKHVSQNVALASFILNIILINVQMSSIGNIRKIIIENKLSPHIFALISGYVVTATLLFEIQTLFYYQWLTKQSLSDILKDLKNEHVYTGNEIIMKIRNLALCNDQYTEFTYI
ncbi:hypothetical protein BLOT_000513 [Blomia tropicalis]|nr:hypothetical protein BLOT_000513 [Blomia tropicalis]